LVTIYDFKTKDQAIAKTLENLREENNSVLDVENNKIALFSDKNYYTWNYDKYVIYFYFDSGFKAPECNGFSCVLKKYVSKLPSELNGMFLDNNCYSWENLKFLGKNQDVCVKFKEDSSYVNPKDPYFCETENDCPGGGKWVFGSSGRYYLFQCKENKCALKGIKNDKCFLDSDCLTGKCSEESLPRKCINVELNETENLSTINLSEGSKQLENSLEKKSSSQIEKILIGIFLFLAVVFIRRNKLKNEK
jgi:hypothetical protein